MAGEGVEVWRQSQDKTWTDPVETLTRVQLIGRIRKLANQDRYGYVVQERLRNHPDLEDLCSNALSTCRITTILNEKGIHEVVEFYWRMSTRPDAVADNFHSGGTFWGGNDFQTGHLAIGVEQETTETQSTVQQHPSQNSRWSAPAILSGLK